MDVDGCWGMLGLWGLVGCGSWACREAAAARPPAPPASQGKHSISEVGLAGFTGAGHGSGAAVCACPPALVQPCRRIAPTTCPAGAALLLRVAALLHCRCVWVLCCTADACGRCCTARMFAPSHQLKPHVTPPLFPCSRRSTLANNTAMCGPVPPTLAPFVCAEDKGDEQRATCVAQPDGTQLLSNQTCTAAGGQSPEPAPAPVPSPSPSPAAPDASPSPLPDQQGGAAAAPPPQAADGSSSGGDTSASASGSDAGASSGSGGSSTNTGAIVGGVIGGLGEASFRFNLFSVVKGLRWGRRRWRRR